MKRTYTSGGRPDASVQEVFLARESALWLLARSIGFGHQRLAVVRLSMAVHAGADVPDESWAYCRTAAVRDATLLALYHKAEVLAGRTSQAAVSALSSQRAH
ncbi:hypothetical protein [Aquabacterium sp.]|uniref:hypothetical protein n=1 Tax=Aquabacterium sp. TaxID=1872578 RepID=UPI0025BD4858|nr:hypothetical protein [Aquabacterium sp.]